MAAVSPEDCFSPDHGRWTDWFNTFKAPAIQMRSLSTQPTTVLMRQQQSGPRQSFQQQPNYLPNGAPQQGGPLTAPTPIPAPGARPLEPNQGRLVQAGSARVLCVADVRGETYLHQPLQAGLTC